MKDIPEVEGSRATAPADKVSGLLDEALIAYNAVWDSAQEIDASNVADVRRLAMSAALQPLTAVVQRVIDLCEKAMRPDGLVILTDQSVEQLRSAIK
jgi:hypothetical protein